MPLNRRQMIEGGALAATLLTGEAAAQTAAAPPRAPTLLGRSDHQFYLAKITVLNLVRSYRFYTEIIGLRLASDRLPPPTDNDPEVDFRELPLNVAGTLADPIFVLVKQPGLTPTPETARLTTIGFKVPNARAALERAAQAGFTARRRDPTNDGPMQFAMVADPDGYMIEFAQAPFDPI